MIVVEQIDVLIADDGTAESDRDERWSVAVEGMLAIEIWCLGLIYAHPATDSVEAAIEGFRLGVESGKSGEPPLVTNRKWDRRDAEPGWCRAHRVTPAAVERVAAVFGGCPKPGKAARHAFRIGHEAATLDAAASAA